MKKIFVFWLLLCCGMLFSCSSDKDDGLIEKASAPCGNQ